MPNYVLRNRLADCVLRKKDVYAETQKPVGLGYQLSTHWLPQLNNGGSLMVKPLSEKTDSSHFVQQAVSNGITPLTEEKA